MPYLADTHRSNLELALSTCRKRRQERPTWLPLTLADEQLSYLLNCLDGLEKDLSHLANINLGLLAAREFEVYDMELAEQIYAALAVQEYLAKMESRQ